MVLTPTTESKLGSDCSGTNGALNRVLTLSNTGKTATGGFLVYASGLSLALTTEYTVVHNSSSSTITFLNRMWDDMTIVVNYYQQPSTTSVNTIMRADVQDIIIDHGSELTLIRQTETVASMGDTTEVSEEEWNIWTLIQDITKKDRKIHEMGLAVPGNSKAFFFHEYPDSITNNGTVSVQAGDIIKDSDDRRWRVEIILAQRQGDNDEVFRTVSKKLTIEQLKMVLFKSMIKMQELATINAPVDTGRLRNSINLRPATPGYKNYVLADGTDYGSHVEYGTKPHWTSAENLKGWSRRVLKDTGAAYAIAGAIAKRGTEAQPFFRPALDQVKIVWIPRYFNQVFNKSGNNI